VTMRCSERPPPQRPARRASLAMPSFLRYLARLFTRCAHRQGRLRLHACYGVRKGERSSEAANDGERLR
jgi:hypothetical protein